MTDWSLEWFYVLNAASAAVLVGLGAIAAFRPDYAKRSMLPLFFIAWGVQLILTNSAVRSNAAQILYAVAYALLPLQAFFLLRYTVQQSSETQTVSDRNFRATANVLSWLVGAAAVTGILLLIFKPSAVFTTSAADGLNSLNEKSWAPLFNVPQFLGVALALTVLALRLQKTAQYKDRLLVAGLAFAWAYTVMYPLSYDVLDPGGSRNFGRIGVLATAGVFAILVVPILLLRSRTEPMRWPYVVGAFSIWAIAVLAWFAPALDDYKSGLVALAPGTPRLVSAAWLLPAVWSAGIGSRLAQPNAQVRVFQVGLALASAMVASIVFAYTTLQDRSVTDAVELWSAVLPLGSLGIILFGTYTHILEPNQPAKPRSGPSKAQSQVRLLSR